MAYSEEFDRTFRKISESAWSATPEVARILHELDFAHRFATVVTDSVAQWQALILRASQTVQEALETPHESYLPDVVSDAEHILAPIGHVAKTYTVHAVGHAHIDMNWMWPWQDTVSVCIDTFSTMDRLMEEFEDFRFCQSQAAIYAAMEKHCPEILERIQRRIHEGRWECIATSWTEGDRNLASGESLCRHLLYSRRYLKEKLGIPFDAIRIDWSCDTFGHAYTVPTILARGGVTRYYRHRTGPEKWLLRWRGPDGSTLLAYYDKATYVHPFDHRLTELFVDYVAETGLKDFLWVYGVGDHGGGPTKRDLIRARELAAYPIYPTIRLSTLDDYFSAVEEHLDRIPVHDGEFNFVFEGCYTSQSRAKRGNRDCESRLPEAETLAVIAEAIGEMEYPRGVLEEAWRNLLFNQFHDILPGSGSRETYEYANGLYQDCLATSSSVRTRALRSLASRVDTCGAFGLTTPPKGAAAGIGEGLGAGAGDTSLAGGLSAYSPGALEAEPVLVFNAEAETRSGMVVTKIWNRGWPKDRIVARDEGGTHLPAQVLDAGHYWGHQYQTVVFPAREVPATGYRVYVLERAAEPAPPTEVATMPEPTILENEHLRATVDPAAGAVSSLVLKASGCDLVPKGELFGLLEGVQEAPNEMSAWTISQITQVEPLRQGARLEVLHRGPNRVAVRAVRTWRETKITSTISLDAGSAGLDFTLEVDWLERGSPSTGVPSLRIAFPLAVESAEARYEIPFGSISRDTNGREVPALRWADLGGETLCGSGKHGITLVNDSKHGHSATPNTLRLTLLRGSYAPDPLPDLGAHTIRLSVFPYAGERSASEAMRLASLLDRPLTVTATSVHEGTYPPSLGFAEVLTPNVRLATLKKAEASSGIVLRLYEVDGKDTEARVRFTNILPPDARATEVDLMEQPLATNTARFELGDSLSVHVPAYGIASVIIK